MRRNGTDKGMGRPAKDSPTTGALAFPARVRAIGAGAAAVDGAGGQESALDPAWFVFAAEISSTALDAFHTHMADSTLRNFARDAGTGVTLLDSHDSYKLGVGYSAGGRYEEEDGDGRAVGAFYIVPGLRFGGQHSFASSDDYIRAIEGGVVRDVSVGFHGGKWICDICHQPYFGQGSTCNHIAGWEYEVEVDGQMQRKLCTVAIHDARLSEVSLVYDGATPGAMILKAEQEAEAGRLTPAMVRQIEGAYRVRLPEPVGRQESAGGQWTVVSNQLVDGNGREWSGYVTTSASTTGTVNIDGRAMGGALAKRGQGEDMDEELEVELEEGAEGQTDTDGQGQDAGDGGDTAGEEARAAVEEVRQALAESAAPQGVKFAEAIRGLNAQLAQAVSERDEAKAEIARLQPLADQGRAYREELVSQAVAEGVRAMGEAFPEETYRAMLAGAPLEHIRQVRDTFAKQAAERFPGGRQTRDVNEDKQPRRPATPAAAYGAQ